MKLKPFAMCDRECNTCAYYDDDRFCRNRKSENYNEWIISRDYCDFWQMRRVPK